MAILFASNEEDPYTFNDAAQTFVRDEAGSPDFPRASASLGLSQNATLVGRFTASDELWLVASVSHTTISVDGDQAFLALRDSGTGQILFQLDGDNGLINAEYWNGAAFVELLSADLNIPISSKLVRHTFYLKLDNSVGVFRWWIDDILIAELTGDTIFTAATTVDEVVLAACNSTTGTLQSTVFSEVIVSEEPTWGLRLATQYATGDGNDTAWTGTFADIDEAGEANDADLITSNTNGQVENFANQNLSTEAADMTIIALVTAFRGRNDGAGVANIQHCVRSGSTNFFSASVTGIDTTFRPFFEIWANDPNTAAPWTVTNINAMQFGVQAIT